MTDSELAEIKSLHQQPLLLKQYFQRFVGSLGPMTGASVAIVWKCSGEQVEEFCKFESENATQIPISKDDHQALLIRASHQSQCVVVRPSNLDEFGETAAPLILLCPIPRRNAIRGDVELVELVINPKHHSDPGEEQRIVKLVNDACQIARNWTEAPEARSPLPSEDQQTLHDLASEAADQFLFAIHESIDRKTTSLALSNEARRLLQCDRVSVAIRSHGKFRLFAISGQTTVNRRSNTTKQLEKLVQKTLKTGRPFWYPDEEVAPQVQPILDDYLAISATRSLAIIPIKQDEPPLLEDPESNERLRDTTIAGIVFEHCSEAWEMEEIQPTIGFITKHGSNALRNACSHQNLFLYPLWNALGKSKFLTGPRLLPKTILALLVACAITLLLAFWPTTFYVSGDGIVLPTQISKIYAQTNGVVERIQVEHGSQTKSGSTLCVLKNEELDIRLQEIAGQIENVKKRVQSIRDERFRSRVDNSQDLSDEQSIKSLEAQIASLNHQQSILERMVEKLTIKSPIDGHVITWDLEKRLQDRPVQNGDMLMEVAKADGSWKLELQLEDRRVGHLMRALDESENGRLPVTFVMAADPGRRLEGEVIGVGLASEISSDNKKTLRLDVKIDETKLPAKHARTGVTAKIICGESSLGYLWLHDIHEFLQKHVFFKFAN